MPVSDFANVNVKMKPLHSGQAVVKDYFVFTTIFDLMLNIENMLHSQLWISRTLVSKSTLLYQEYSLD